MKQVYVFILFFAVVALFSCSTESYKTVLREDANGYQYEEVTNDPSKTRVYTLGNGLKIYLSINKDEPRVKTQIAVRAGSLNDPKNNSGLAHYFEHLLFKGTDEIGTINWEEEKILIDSISKLFEVLRISSDKNQRNRIFHDIDKVSAEAAKYAIPNDYDHLLSVIGANGTNAVTSWEYTSYLNEIPSNEVKRWLELEYERFSDPVLRLFHTELETVYEEFNMAQDKDDRRLMQVMLANVFQKHPLGIPIIGLPKDLRNQSMVNIMNFFNTWYVPNNMAILMSGDLNPEQIVQLVESTFGQMKSKALPEMNHPKEDPIKEPVVKNIYGPDMEMLNMVFRFDGRKTDDRLMVYMVDMLLNNATAGLIDLNLVQQQKVLFAGCSPMFMNDYGVHFFYGVPRAGQTLDDTRELILGQIQKIKEGAFEPWLMEAVVNSLRVSEIKKMESNFRIETYLNAFIFKSPLSEELSFLDRLERVSKSDVIAFAREHYKDNYVVVNKLNGEAKGLVRIDKPAITPMIINRDIQSEFLKTFLKEEPSILKPEFLDFDNAMERIDLGNGVKLKYLQNTNNDLFNLTFIFDIGSDNDPELALAMDYLPYLGTKTYSPNKIREEFYKLGIVLKTGIKSDQSIVSIRGLERNFLPGIELLEHLLSEAIADADAYAKMAEGILTHRFNVKKNPKMIRTALENYGKYGENSAFRNVLSEQQIHEMNPERLIDKLKMLSKFKHTVFYYGAKRSYDIRSIINNVHGVSTKLSEPPVAKNYSTNDFSHPRVLFLDYPKSQVDIVFLSKDVVFDPQLKVIGSIFNEYYGNKMSSVVFQEIRESQALAYSAWAEFESPEKAGQEFFVSASISSQADKMNQAISSMNQLLNKMVCSENSYKISCKNVIKTIQSERIVKQDIFWTCLKNKKLGLNDDIRKGIYSAAQDLSLQDIQTFFDAHIANKNYTYLIIGNKEELNLEYLKRIAPVEELNLEQLFNY